jgi:predicted transposase YbfD/YdcC
VVDEKSNEIPAVQALIATLGLSGRVFTLDAMHCQKNNLGASPPVGTETVCARLPAEGSGRPTFGGM